MSATGGIEGVRCVVAGADTPLRAALADGLRGAGAAVSEVPPADSAATASELAGRAREELGGPLDALVATPPPLEAAGIDELDVDRFDGALAAGYRSPFLHTQALLPDLRLGGGGRIAYVTSAAGLLGRAYTAHLAATARAVIALMRTVAVEEAPAVTANAIATGPMDGDPLLGARIRGLAGRTDVAAADGRAAVAERLPLGRLTDAEDVLSALRWALAAESGFLTGQVVTVAGGGELQVWP